MGHVAEVQDAGHPVAVEQQVVEGQVIVDDLRAEGGQRRRHEPVIPREGTFDHRASSRVRHRVKVRAQGVEMLEVPQDRPASRRMEEAAQGSTHARGDATDLPQRGRGEVAGLDVASGQERNEPDLVSAASPARDLDRGQSILCQPRHGDRQGRVHPRHVADGLHLHVDHGRILDPVRDLQDPGRAVRIGQSEVLVALADERGRRPPNAEQGDSQVLRLARGEVGRIRSQHVGPRIHESIVHTGPVNDDEPDYIQRNRRVWDGYAAEYVEAAERAWDSAEPSWGIWGVPESELHLLPDDLEGRDVIELGCGTAYVSAWLARRGARVTGIDNSPAQLETARRLQQEHGLEFPVLLGYAEAVPLPDASFDLAISEYGAAIWADPYRWIPEASRLLRPGGELIFLGNSVLVMLAIPDLEEDGPATDRLLRPQFGMHRFEWADEDSVEFHVSHGDMIRLLRANRLEIVDLVEIQPPADATTRHPNIASIEWARRWPSEEVWKARKQ